MAPTGEILALVDICGTLLTGQACSVSLDSSSVVQAHGLEEIDGSNHGRQQRFAIKRVIPKRPGKPVPCT